MTGVDAAAVIARLRRLDGRSGGRRVAWTDCWAQERERHVAWMAEHVPRAATSRDAAGNLWTRLPGETTETVVVGSHLDSVPDGGWLDGCLGVYAASALAGAVAYVELHIEQGPVLDEAQLAAAAVDGCLGVRRSSWTIGGRAGHAGATPMALRRDPVQAAAAAVQGWRAAAEAAGVVATTGVLRAEPPTPTPSRRACG